jgi:hypothetical protein
MINYVGIFQKELLVFIYNPRRCISKRSRITGKVWIPLAYFVPMGLQLFVVVRCFHPRADGYVDEAAGNLPARVHVHYVAELGVELSVSPAVELPGVDCAVGRVLGS